jgi:glycosyltransferase EpsD
MLSGTPVVASVNRGHKELIRDGENGFLVSIDDEQRMSERVLEILNSNQVAATLRENALKYISDYSNSIVRRELESIYFKSLKGEFSV